MGGRRRIGLGCMMEFVRGKEGCVWEGKDPFGFAEGDREKQKLRGNTRREEDAEA